MFKPFKKIILLLSMVMIVACTAAPGSESTGEFLDSSTLTTKVKASLINDLGTKGFAIKVKTFKDEVQLSGFVHNADIKQRAGIIAANVPGVYKIRNDIIIK